ncbi:MAG: prolipoprotein diacylglyceryl transferase [Turicibacter sp.]|nr:prolipoprotein diacylglyceryl transferase [Turicibacter sp.]
MNHAAIEPLNPVFISLGPISIAWYAVMILTGVFVGYLFAAAEGRRMGIKPEFFQDLVMWGLPISIVGARIYYVAFNWDFYASNPGYIIQIQRGGLAIHGALIVVFVYGLVYCRKKGFTPWLIMDIGFVSFFISQAIGRWGNFFNQEAHGGIVPGATIDAQREFLTGMSLPRFVVDGMFINGAYHHPTFLYEGLWNLVGFALAVLILRRLSNLLVGEIAAFYGIWYSIGRFFIEGMRTDSLMLTEHIRMAQFISIAIILAIVLAVAIRRAKKLNVETYSSYYGGKKIKKTTKNYAI